MARYVVTKPVTLAGSGYAQPPRTVAPGQVLELSAAEVTALGGGNLRTTTASTAHDQLGESAGVSNGN
jgi:hypothetical protein